VEVPFGQDGSLDDQNSFSTETQPEDNMKVQSVENSDLQLVVHGNEDETPPWITPFDTPQLRKMLASASTLQPLAAIPWLQNHAARSSSQAQLPFALSQNIVSDQVLLLGPPMPDEVYTINNKLITKVYYRRKFKARKRNTSDANQDFEQSEVDDNAPEVDQGGNISTHKRKPTPAAVTKLDAMMVTSPPQLQGAWAKIRKFPQD
jgi:hypothetical protein